MNFPNRHGSGRRNQLGGNQQEQQLRRRHFEDLEGTEPERTLKTFQLHRANLRKTLPNSYKYSGVGNERFDKQLAQCRRFAEESYIDPAVTDSGLL